MEAPPWMSSTLPSGERRWLHDKYEKLAEHEAQLADYRTSYFAVLNSALVAGMVLVVINLLRNPPVFATTSTLLAGFGILMASVWAVVLHRTIAAQNLWRDAALALETDFPPVTAPLIRRVPGGRAGEEISVDLARPYHAHRLRFSRDSGAGYLDTVRPAELWSNVPVLLTGAWVGVIVVVWAWYWFYAFA
ncbi:MAG TPA: hypothetical protein VEY07_01395 [Thermoplasmata archaeon]|nr:hypothetical protein [Thermoplasmata archaeon]